MLAKRLSYILLGYLMMSNVLADTIDHFMNIANNIPQMEMKADSQSQAWARSARNILDLTSESIAESLLLANDTASRNGQPLFCLPAGTHLTAEIMNHLIQQTYREISSQLSDKNQMTVSKVALVGVTKHYPCQTHPLQKQISTAMAINRALRPNVHPPGIVK